MILIDKPYASPFLINTLIKNQWPVVDTPSAREVIQSGEINWIDPEKACKQIIESPSSPLYSNSENALEWVEKNLKETGFYKFSNLFKDKYKFREILSQIYPDFQFLKVKLNELNTLKEETLPYPFVIKPSIGFFSVGVHVVRNSEEWNQAKKELLNADFAGLFPENVLDTSYFIIEEMITGEEFAVDFYYNENGEPVILNITKHLFASETDTSDRVYFTSKEIILENEPKIKEFLNRMGKIIDIKNFPAHAEIRITPENKIIPIEINPLRFGGWSTTAEIPGLGIGFNVYEAYFNRILPDWDQIYKGKEDKVYSIVLLDNSSGIPASEILSFDYEKLAADFENPIKIRKFDIHHAPVFGFLFTETPKNNMDELYQILQSDLKKYINTRKE